MARTSSKRRDDKKRILEKGEYNKLIEYYKNHGAENDEIKKLGNKIDMGSPPPLPSWLEQLSVLASLLRRSIAPVSCCMAQPPRLVLSSKRFGKHNETSLGDFRERMGVKL